MRLSEIKLETMERRIIKEGIESVLQDFEWKGFENAIAEIFSLNGFKVKQNFRFKTKRRYEIDIVATHMDVMLCIDCKQWRGGRYKNSSLRRAITMQKERVKEFKKFLSRNSIAQRQFSIGKHRIYPLIVTLLEEDLIEFGDCFVVPAWKLNSFLIDIESFL